MVTERQPAAPAAEKPEVDAETKALVSRWLGRIQAAEKYWEDDFKRIREDMEIARLGATGEWVAAGNYTVPIVMRHVNQAVATLYAKNPTAVYERRKRLQFKLWDGTDEMAAQALVQPMVPDPAGAQTVDPLSGAQMPALMPNPVLAEIMEVKAQNQMTDKVGKTLEILWQYYNEEQEPNFKKLMKQAVRRAKVCGVAYGWLDFQRIFENRPDLAAKITDISEKIARIERQAAQVEEGEIREGDAELADLKLSLADLQKQTEVIVREGPIRDFPRAAGEIILDPATKQVNGLIGTNWLARKSLLTPDEVREAFKKDIGAEYTPYREGKDGAVQKDSTGAERNAPGTDDKVPGKAAVYRVYDKPTQMTFVVVEGYSDFLVPPAAPAVALSRFWPLFVLTLNDVESEKAGFPIGDVRMLAHPQAEYNRARQSLREHRVANRPAYLTPTGMLEPEDEAKITDRPAHAIVHTKAIQVGQKASDVLAPLEFARIDPALYDVAPLQQDILLSVGSQVANLGPTGGATATEASIADASANTVESSNSDDIDMFLGELAAAQAEVMLLNLSPATVLKIAGPGAVWPEIDRQTMAESVTLTVKAGSSGKPNQAAEIAKIERAAPLLVQLPGVNPKPLVRKYADLLELDPEEMILEAIPLQPMPPSITAMNAAAGRPAVAPSDDPNAQGGQGGDNGKKPARGNQGGQPAYPSGPMQVMRFDQAGNPVQ